MAPRKQFSLKEVFFGSWKNKLFALFLAVVIWFFAYGNEIVKTTLTFEVRLRTTDGFVIVAERVEEGRARGRFFDHKVELTVDGQKGVLEELEGQRLEATVLVQPTGDGRIDLRLEEHYQLPGGVQILSAEPSLVECEIERLVVRTLKVEPYRDVQGTPPPGQRIEAVTPTKINVDVRGPEGAFEDRIGPTELRVGVEPFFLDPNELTKKDVPLRLFDIRPKYDASLLSFVGESKVDVTVRLESTLDEGVIQDVPVRWSLPTGVFVKVGSTDKVTVVVRGPPEEIQKLKAMPDLKLLISSPSFADGEYTADLKEMRFLPPLPPTVSLVRFSGGEPTYRLSVEPQ